MQRTRLDASSFFHIEREAAKSAPWALAILPPQHTLTKTRSRVPERLQAALLGDRFGGMNDARRDKFLMNEAMRDAGLSAARQIKSGDRAKVREFLETLKDKPTQWTEEQTLRGAADAAGDPAAGESSQKLPSDVSGLSASKDQVPDKDQSEILRTEGDALLGVSVDRQQGTRQDGGQGSFTCLDGVLSVVKPARGCASGSVFRCNGEDEAMEAFEKILGTPKYGTPGAFNDEVPSVNT